MQSVSGRHEHVFYSHGKSGHLSEGAVLGALRRMGYNGEEMTGHGLRAMAKTVMLEVLKMPDQYIELQLGHKVRDPNGGAYNRVTHRVCGERQTRAGLGSGTPVREYRRRQRHRE